MGLLSSTSPSSTSLIEGVVAGVDSQRQCCEVSSVHGQKLTNVLWLLPSGGNSRTGQHTCPTVGDKVVISFDLGYPIIIGFLPGLTTYGVNPATLDTGVGVDTGNLSSSQDASANFNPGCPPDSMSGDHIFTSEGGGVLALLRQGTIILRSSRLAQITISKFDDLVRIVGRNYEVFTDVFVDCAFNIKSRIYRYRGYATTQAGVRNDEYEYEEFLGDTAMAEFAKQEGFNPSLGTPPLKSGTIRKIKVNGKLTQVFDLDGHHGSTVVNTGTSTRDQRGASVIDKVIAGGTSTVSLLGSSIVIDQDSVSTITLTANDIVAVHGDAKVTLNAGMAEIRFGGHGVTVDAGGVHTF